MNRFNKKFNHSIWYKGENMTVKEFLERAATSFSFYLDKKISKNQSNNLFDDLIYDNVIKCEEGRGFYKVTEQETKYFKSIKDFSYNWRMEYDKLNFKEEYRTDTKLYTDYFKKLSEQFEIDYNTFILNLRKEMNIL